MERVRCMILSSGVSKELWTEALMSAVYIVNRSPTVALKEKTPAEVWYGYRPDLSKLRVFGCIGYVRLPNELIKGKFDSRIIKYIMVGYCPNGYRMWNPAERKIIHAFDVCFDENAFWKDVQVYSTSQIQAPFLCETLPNSTTEEDTPSGGVNQSNSSTNSNSPESVEEDPTSDSSDDKQLRRSQRQHK